MKCTAVRSKLAGYLDDVVESSSRTSERGEMREHLEYCAYCREELQRYRKLEQGDSALSFYRLA